MSNCTTKRPDNARREERAKRLIARHLGNLEKATNELLEICALARGENGKSLVIDSDRIERLQGFVEHACDELAEVKVLISTREPLYVLLSDLQKSTL